MATWLYQMSAESYSPERYREDVWEGQITRWPTGNVRSESGAELSPGDIIILAFVKTGTHEPGIYGWGIITNYREGSQTIFFRPTYPSDFLKMIPIWGGDVSDILDKIRGPVKVGTMWEMQYEFVAKLREKIHAWIS